MKFNRDSLNRQVGRRLRQLRKQFNRSLDEMAKKMGVSKSAYYKNEGGLHIPDWKTLNLLQSEYNISLDWLIFNKGPRNFQTKLKVGEYEKERERLEKEWEGGREWARIRKGITQFRYKSLPFIRKCEANVCRRS
ncbi:MAG: helix-turn-helix transcriptional regulator [bacterium]|nr:helix-turn-helix transcriptional regulator [bacterium]